MQDLLNQLDNIFEVLRFTQQISPPITDIELTNNLENLPLELPTFLTNLYKWHNGIEEFIPAFRLLSLQDAISIYEALIEYLREIEAEFGNCEFYKNTYFPILQHQNLYFVIDCHLSANGNIYVVDAEDDAQPSKEYENLEQMFQVIVDAYLSGAYYVEDEFLYDNPVLFEKVKNKYLSETEYIQKEEDWQNISSQASQFIKSQSPERKYFVGRLYESYDERAIPYLLKFLNDSDLEVISSAAFGLGELRSRESLPELISFLKHPIENLRITSTSTIEKIISPQDKLLLQPLLDILNDKSISVRISAINALGNLRSLIAYSALLNLLRNRKSGIRISAATALGKIGNSVSLEALKERRKERIKGLELQVIERIIKTLERDNNI